MKKEFQFNYVYELANLVQQFVRSDGYFYNFDEDFFLKAAVKFSKDTLLHQFIFVTACGYYRQAFYADGDLHDERSMEKWYSLFHNYGLVVQPYDLQQQDRQMEEWFDQHEDQFQELFEKMTEEVFHILFQNRGFLLEFNLLASRELVRLGVPAEFATPKGTIKRRAIPVWVRDAVYHRDKGLCVFCSTNLTKLVNTLVAQNYDHILPLDLFGVNDPCNIQLCCESCNKKKSNNPASTSRLYIPWWS